MPQFESISTSYFVGYKCPLTKCSNNSISIRARTNQLEQKGAMIKNIYASHGTYKIDIRVNIIGCSIYWYGTYENYKMLQLIQGSNTFNIEIKTTQKDAFDIGILSSNLLIGKHFDVAEIKVTKISSIASIPTPQQPQPVTKSVQITPASLQPVASASLQPVASKPLSSASVIVSVVLPTLNRLDGFKKVIENFRYQTFPNFELIAIDDGSDINIYNDKKMYIDKLNDTRFRMIRNPNNIGTASSLNKGIISSVGQYVTWISDDNEYYNNYLKYLYNPAYDFIYSYWDYMDNFKKSKVTIKADYNLENLLNNFKGLGAFMWKKSFMDKIGYYDDTIRGCEDYDYLLRTFNNTDKILLNKVSTMKYVYHSDCVFYKNFDGIIEIKNNISDVYKNIINFNNVHNINIYYSSLPLNTFLDKYSKYFNDSRANILMSAHNAIVYYNNYKLLCTPFKYQIIVAHFCKNKTTNIFYTNDNTSKNYVEIIKKLITVNKIEILVENKNISTPVAPCGANGASEKSPIFGTPVQVTVATQPPVPVNSLATSYVVNDGKRSVIFINIDATGAGTWWYKNVNSMYQKILKAKNYNIKTINIKSKGYELDKNWFNELYSARNSDIYVLNPINFASFMITLKHYPVLRTKFTDFLKSIKYIVIWQEILAEDISIVGYQENYIDKDFILMFFRNSKLNLVSNLTSINILEKNSIMNNKYFIITGYSEINGIVPFNTNDVPFIDILIYGDLSSGYTYRNNIINQIKQKNKQKLNISIIDNVFGNELEHYLKKAKIVLHVPSYPNLNHMPWPKITLLQSKKIFFIVEENSELFEKNLENTVVYYKRNDVDDIFTKVNFYLENLSERQNKINANFTFIKNNYNIDIIIPEIIDKLV